MPIENKAVFLPPKRLARSKPTNIKTLHKMSKKNESAKTSAANMSEGNTNTSAATIEINGKTYQNVTERLEAWLTIDGVQTSEIVAKFGEPLYLVRQIFDAQGNEMTKGQKTLCAFQTLDGKLHLIDKTAINKAFGVAIAERANTGNTTSGKTNAERAAAAINKIAAAVAELSLSDDNKIAAAEHFAAIVDMLNAAAEKERETAAAAAKRAAAIAALVAVGFDETTAAATVDRQGK